MSHLLSISLGPVQDFIASARRTRDFWFGSELLSRLARAAAQAVAESSGGLDSLIFPAPRSAEELERLGVANKILAVVEDPARAAHLARAAVLEELRSEYRVAEKDVAGQPFYDAEAARLQIEDLPEIYWAAVEQTGDYPADRARVEALLAARKNTRDFSPVTWGSDRPKASLDGLRESVLDLSALSDRQRESWAHRLGVRPGEILCAVSLLKRRGARGEEGSAFASVAHVTAGPLLDRLRLEDKPRVQEFQMELRSLLPGGGDLDRVPQAHQVFGPYDGHILFAERLEEDFGERTADAQAALARFLKDLRLPAPQPYYALLHADGDRMGAALEAQKTPDQHRRLSRALAGFADGAGEIIREHGGLAVYLGGDDVLAFLPLHRALHCATALAQDFAYRLAGFPSPKGAPTLSVGIAVCHQMEPLGDALNLARKMEKLAKKDRNCLAVAVDRRSGSPVQVVGAWTESPRTPLHGRLLEWAHLLRSEALPQGVAYELRQLVLSLGEESPELVAREAGRILSRKQTERGRGGKLDKTVMKALLGEGLPAWKIGEVANEILVARSIADAFQVAGQPILEVQH
ncbi:MAG: type III-B CRISPR-associated protein Cas10/Cmr2 [Candidatus Xenobium sp.]|jgi:CRISPR-associated protein Cmr2|nr:type III-B CRISPR-associated protein Cas10/Cmr2 [Burkholderiales bacterium]